MSQKTTKTTSELIDRIDALEKYVISRSWSQSVDSILLRVFFAFVSDALEWDILFYIFLVFVALGIIHLLFGGPRGDLDNILAEEKLRSTPEPILTQEEWEDKYKHSMCPSQRQ